MIGPDAIPDEQLHHAHRPLRRAARALDETVSAIGDLLDRLHQNDFELLIELIFSSRRWHHMRRTAIALGILETA